MSNELLTIGGLNIASPRLRTQVLSGLLTVPARRTENLAVAGRHGKLRTPRKRYDANELVVPVYALGVGEDGLISDNELNEFYRGIDDLVRVIASADAVVVAYTRPDTTERLLEVEVLQTVNVERWKQGTLANIALVLSAPDPFWRDDDPVSASTTSTGGPTAWTLTEFADATAPMCDGIVTFTATSGSIPNPRLTSSAGVYVEYLDTLATGESIEIDIGNRTLQGAGGLTEDWSDLNYFGDDYWWVAEPGVYGGTGPTATVQHGGGGTLTVEFDARRKYLTG